MAAQTRLGVEQVGEQVAEALDHLEVPGDGRFHPPALLVAGEGHHGGEDDGDHRQRGGHDAEAAQGQVLPAVLELLAEVAQGFGKHHRRWNRGREHKKPAAGEERSPTADPHG